MIDKIVKTREKNPWKCQRSSNMMSKPFMESNASPSDLAKVSIHKSANCQLHNPSLD
jgi:hypothetical protein